MTSITYSAVSIQTSSLAVPSTPCWLGEIVLISRYLHQLGVLDAITRASPALPVAVSGAYAVIDFVAVLFAYAISSERTLEAFYEQLARLRADLYGALRTRPPAYTLDAQPLSFQHH